MPKVQSLCWTIDWLWRWFKKRQTIKGDLICAVLLVVVGGSHKELKAAVAAQKEAVEVEKRRLGQAQEHLGCEVRAIRGLMEQLQSVANNLESVKAETAKAKEVGR